MTKFVFAAAFLSSFSCAHRTSTVLGTTAQVKTPASAMDRQILNAVDAGDGDAELRLLRSRVINSPSSVSARLELGKAYERRGFLELALDHYRWAVEHAPESPDAHLMLARTLDHSQHSAEAIALLQAFLVAHSQPGPTLYSWLGIMQDDAGDWKASERNYREALVKAPADKDYLHNNLGFALLKQEKSELAAVEFRAALKLNPHSEIARDNLGIALASANSKEAILNWQSMNEPATAHSNLAAVLMERGKYPEARQELQIALKYNQANPAALKNLELLSSLEGKPVQISSGNVTTRWARFKSTWRRWFDGGVEPAARQQVQTASKISESK